MDSDGFDQNERLEGRLSGAHGVDEANADGLLEDLKGQNKKGSEQTLLLFNRKREEDTIS